jgi:hypothetical protein
MLPFGIVHLPVAPGELTAVGRAPSTVADFGFFRVRWFASIHRFCSLTAPSPAAAARGRLLHEPASVRFAVVHPGLDGDVGNGTENAAVVRRIPPERRLATAAIVGVAVCPRRSEVRPDVDRKTAAAEGVEDEDPDDTIDDALLPAK